MKIHGHTAIEAARNDSGIVLHKYEDPTEGAMEGITLDEAEAIAREDPGLIWAEVVVRCEINGVEAECPEGHNISDYYDSDGSHKGPDEDGVSLFLVAP